MLRRLLVGVALALATEADQTEASEVAGGDPYQVPRPVFRETVTRLALRSLVLPPGVVDPTAVREAIERQLAAGLRRLGYEVIDPAITEANWREMSTRIGGVYDPLTGARDDERHAVVWEHTARELSLRHGANAVASPRIRIGDVQSWVARRSVLVGREIVWSADQELWKGPRIHVPAQKVRGAFLGLSIRNLAGVELYSIETALQWTEVVLGGGHRVIAETERYRDEELNRRAIGVLLAPLEAVPGSADDPANPSTR